MFEYEAESAGFSTGLLMLQVFAVPPINLVLGMVLAAALAPGPRGTGVAENVVGYLVFSIQGFCIGYALVPSSQP